MLAGKPECDGDGFHFRVDRNWIKPRLLQQFGNLEGAVSPGFNMAAAIEDAGNQRVPGSGFVRLLQLFRGKTKVKLAG